MIVLIGGASHTGKTVLAQKLLEKYRLPYLSLDLLKMGLIRSKNTRLTPEDDEQLTDYLWPIAREMIKTAVENGQSLIVEGGYIPHDWKKDFSEVYLKQIRYRCLAMSEAYIEKNFDLIRRHAEAAERRHGDGWCTKEGLIADNRRNLELCRKHANDFVLIDETYRVDWDL